MLKGLLVREGVIKIQLSYRTLIVLLLLSILLRLDYLYIQ